VGLVSRDGFREYTVELVPLALSTVSVPSRVVKLRPYVSAARFVSAKLEVAAAVFSPIDSRLGIVVTFSLALAGLGSRDRSRVESDEPYVLFGSAGLGSRDRARSDALEVFSKLRLFSVAAGLGSRDFCRTPTPAVLPYRVVYVTGGPSSFLGLGA
jgi:hypothetical protein